MKSNVIVFQYVLWLMFNRDKIRLLPGKTELHHNIALNVKHSSQLFLKLVPPLRQKFPSHVFLDWQAVNLFAFSVSPTCLTYIHLKV